MVGVADEVKGQKPMAFAVVRNPATIATPELRVKLESEVMARVDAVLGAIGRPCHVHFVLQLPKTRSGKVLRRSIKAVAEGHDPGDLTTLDDPAGMEQIERAVMVKVSGLRAFHRRARILRRDYRHDLEFHQIGPGQNPLLQQAQIVRLH